MDDLFGKSPIDEAAQSGIEWVALSESPWECRNAFEMFEQEGTEKTEPMQSRNLEYSPFAQLSSVQK